MEYRLKKQYQEGAGRSPVGSALTPAARELLQRLLALPDGAGVAFKGEIEFVELERAGYLRLVTNRRRCPSGEVLVSSHICHVYSFPLWPLAQINPDLFLGLPFNLPHTDEASDWLAELDFTDPYDGDLDEVRALAEQAPSSSAKNWMNGLIAARERLALPAIC